MRVVQRSDLDAAVVDEFRVRRIQPAVFEGLLVEECARIGRRQRDLNRVRIDAIGEADRLLDGFEGFSRQSQDERAVDGNAQLVAILGESLGHVNSHAFLDVVKDLLVSRLVADQKQP